MEYSNYLLYLQGTVEQYSLKIKKHIMDLFLEEHIAHEQKQIPMSKDGQIPIDVTEIELIEQIKSCLNQNKRSVKIFEQWEFEKDYKYSTIFTLKHFDQIIQEIDLKEYDNESSFLSDTLLTPVVYNSDNLLMLKFSLGLSAIQPSTQEEACLKYPIVVVFHKQSKLVEFRFDALKRIFLSERSEQTVYADIVFEVKNYIEKFYSCSLKPLSTLFMVDLSKDKMDGVILLGQYTKSPRGGNAQLEVGKNQEYILPIIGDLKEVILKHQFELETVPSLKESLEQLVFENEEMSDYSWIEVLWENEIKTRSKRAKFIFNYKNSSFDLIQHYSSSVLVGMERMNYVTDFISEYQSNFDQ